MPPLFYFKSVDQQIMFTVATIVLTIWTLPWKGWALWRAARKGSRPWFVALLILNTVGILEILYIFVFSKERAAKEPAPPAGPPPAQP